MDTTTKNVIDFTAWELYALSQGYNEQEAREFYSRTDWGITDAGRVHKLQDKLHVLFREFFTDADTQPKQTSDPVAELVAKLTDRQKDALLELHYQSGDTATYFDCGERSSFKDLHKLWTRGMYDALRRRSLVEENAYHFIRLTPLGRDVVDYLRS